MDTQDTSNVKPEKQLLTTGALRRQNVVFRGSGGVSEENRSSGFAPAFLDMETGNVYLARFADGRQAPMHLLDGLPQELVIARQDSGTVSAVKATVVAGFLRRSRFFTREQTARAMRLAQRIHDRLNNQTHVAALH